MATEGAPVCARHPDRVRMDLITLHSGPGATGRFLLGLFECPACGAERRVPLPLEPAEVAQPA